MLLSEYLPKSALITKVTPIEKPRFPVVDAHNHLGSNWDALPLSELLELFDQAGVRRYVDLDGGWGEEILQRHLDRYKNGAPERFLVYGGVNWSAWPEKGAGFPTWAVDRLRQQAVRGAQGLKIWKAFGLSVRDHHGALVAVDDRRLDPIWQAAGELNLPVAIHVADPVAFFWPLDANNERWEELLANPDWHFPHPPYPPFRPIVEGLVQIVRRHPETTFVGAHVGCYAENLAWVGALLDECPNFYVDIAARIAELGRQPYTARKFFLKYADRILFGTDVYPNVPAYRVYYRFLETDDEYFHYDPDEESVPGQGRWSIYGLFLPDDVLMKVYYKNAERVLRKD